jgi:hypothetical protein
VQYKKKKVFEHALKNKKNETIRERQKKKKTNLPLLIYSKNYFSPYQNKEQELTYCYYISN